MMRTTAGTEPSRRLRWVLVGAAALGAFAIGVAIPALLLEGPEAGSASPSGPTRVEEPETELILLYFGKSTCRWCASEEAISAMTDIQALLRKRALESGVGFTAIGVALDSSVEAGLEYLRRHGDWDQVVSGGGWRNVLALGGSVPVGGTPEAVVLIRRISRVETASGQVVTAVDESVMLARKVGLYEILAWRNGGATLPAYESSKEVTHATR